MPAPAEYPMRGREHVRRLKGQVESALRYRLERNACCMSCLAFWAGVAGLYILLLFGEAVLTSFGLSAEFMDNESSSLILLVIIFGLAIAAGYAADRSARRNERALIRRELAYNLVHFRRVLYDQGLLALVLSVDLAAEVPGLGRVAGIPGSEVLMRRGGAQGVSLARRLQLVFDYYGLICRHFRIEPYPDRYEYGVFPVSLRGAVYHAFVLALAEGVLGEQTDIELLAGER